MMNPLNPLNPAAGDVPMPEDGREIDAALRAGRLTHRIFPYVDWRYGERGRRFTRSDSAWLAWLTRYEQDRIDEQIRWLRSVLSNRGMPSWILETHLGVLCRHLSLAIPERKQHYLRLAASADRLRHAREGKFTDQRTDQLITKFLAALGRNPNRLLSGTGRLIVSAVADEKLGVKNAVVSLEAWLTDLPQLRKLAELRKQLSESERSILESESFQQRWTSAIAETVADARRNGRHSTG